MNSLPNIRAIARRELTVRLRTRAFRFGTLVLLAGVLAIAFAPLIVRAIEGSTTERIAVVDASGLAADPVATLDAILAPPGGDPDTAILVTAVPTLDAGLGGERDGTYVGVLTIRRAASGELEFRLYTDERPANRIPQLIAQAAATLTAQDRLVRLGVGPAAQASLFAGTDFSVEGTDPERASAPASVVEEGAQVMLGFGLTILIFMMILLYGNWVAMSVVEEKSSRVMEVILNAATPFQLLSGKVLGVGGAAAVQYAAILLVGGIALAVQDPVSSLVLGQSASTLALPEGLTIGVLLMFVIYGVLGFLLYAVLYAAAGSLVSRQEDVNSVVQPLTLLASVGYIVAVYTSIGLIDVGGAPLTILSLFPFTSPFMVLSRTLEGTIAPWEVGLSLAILVVSIVGALWVAARIYAAGVLLYGQRPSVRTVWQVVRTGS
ncbi:MAG TPA: ABC transporter permease [Candidatus Limnocylindrales bacterium]|jgi:ABC-2 type transport system permease protein